MRDESRLPFRASLSPLALAGLVVSLTLAACTVAASQPASIPRVVDDAALADEASGNNWLAYGRTYSEQRFSPLTQINATTVSRLAPDWFLELPTCTAAAVRAMALVPWRAVWHRTCGPRPW